MKDPAHLRLHHQHLLRPERAPPEDVVRRLGAVQAQEYPSAKWALGLRAKGLDEVQVDAAFDEGRILRTHVLRPTWHFVLPEDLRWMNELTAPRVQAHCAYHHAKEGLDAAAFRKARRALEAALAGGAHLTRAEIARVLGYEGTRLGHVMLEMELQAVVVSGARKGKQHTYALFDARVPPAPRRTRDEALAELTARYFASRSPATLADFAWWSGLTIADAKRGADAAGLVEEGPYRLSPENGASARMKRPHVVLLPSYDEYLVAYADRAAAIEGEIPEGAFGSRDSIFTNVVARDGKLVGTWRRTFGKASVEVEVQLFRDLDDAERRALEAAAERYGAFHGLETVLRAGA